MTYSTFEEMCFIHPERHCSEICALCVNDGCIFGTALTGEYDGCFSITESLASISESLAIIAHAISGKEANAKA